MDSPCWRAVARAYTTNTASSAPTRLASSTPPTGQLRAERDGQHRAERRAGGDAERVGRRQRIAQQTLEHDAGRGERAADQRRRQRARQPRDEKDLRVDVVRERRRVGLNTARARIGVEPMNGATRTAATIATKQSATTGARAAAAAGEVTSSRGFPRK